MFTNPVETLESCAILASETIAEFGAGSGFIARAACACVPKGQVFAIEIKRDIVTRLTRDAHEYGITNLHVLWGNIESIGGSHLSDESVSFVILSNVLFQVEDKNIAIREARRILSPGGRMLIIDWTESFNHMGPAPHHVFPQAMAEALVTHEKFSILDHKVITGEHHYGILCKKI